MCVCVCGEEEVMRVCVCVDGEEEVMCMCVCVEGSNEVHALCTKAVGVEFGEGVECETEAILGGRETHIAEQGRYHHAFFTF